MNSFDLDLAARQQARVVWTNGPDCPDEQHYADMDEADFSLSVRGWIIFAIGLGFTFGIAVSALVARVAGVL